MEMIQENEYGKFGYGSMHLSDAGVCFIDHVVSYNPDVCFIDWFSTSKTNYGDGISVYLDCLVLKLLENNIKPVFLLFPISEMLAPRVEMYDTVRKYALKYAIQCLDINEKSKKEEIDISTIIKDYVHTTDFGGYYYASKILELLGEDFFNKKDAVSNCVRPEKNKYYGILKKEMNIEVKKFINFLVEDELIGIYQTIGPYSNNVNIFKEGKLIQKCPIWDCWCHYERDTFKLCIKEPGRYFIELANDIDKSACKVQKNWGDFVNALNLKDAFYTSNFLVEDYE
jgi:hypothetical protein